GRAQRACPAAGWATRSSGLAARRPLGDLLVDALVAEAVSATETRSVAAGPNRITPRAATPVDSLRRALDPLAGHAAYAVRRAFPSGTIAGTGLGVEQAIATVACAPRRSRPARGHRARLAGRPRSDRDCVPSPDAW